MIFPFPILFPSPYPHGVQVYDFKSLLAKIFKNKQRMEEFFKKNSRRHADMVTVKDFDRAILLICHKYYYEEDEHWVIETTKFQLQKNELPNEICKKLEKSKSGEEVDITDFIEAELDKFKKR